MTSRQLLIEVRMAVSWGTTRVGACGADEMTRSWLEDPRGGGRLAMRSLMFCASCQHVPPWKKLQTHALGDARPDPGDEPLQALGAHRRQHQRRPVLAGRKQRDAFFKTRLERLQRLVQLHQQPCELAGARGLFLVAQLRIVDGRPHGGRHDGCKYLPRPICALCLLSLGPNAHD
jgi:hypothetical protein